MACPLPQGETLQDAHAKIDNLPHHNRRRRDNPNENECHVAHRQPVECRVVYSFSSHCIEFHDTRFVYKDIHAPAASKDADEVEQCADQEDGGVAHNKKPVEPGGVAFVFLSLLLRCLPYLVPEVEDGNEASYQRDQGVEEMVERPTPDAYCWRRVRNGGGTRCDNGNTCPPEKLAG